MTRLVGGAEDRATTRCGSIVTGTGPGAAIENITPVMSIRVDGPGAWRMLNSSTNRAETICMRRGYRRSRRTGAGVPCGRVGPMPTDR